MKIKTLVLLFCATATLAVAQSGGGKLYLQPQVQWLSLQNANDVLSNNDLPNAGALFSSGFGGYGYSERWIVGGEGTYFSSAFENNSNSTLVSGGWGCFYAGYKLLKRNKVMLYPAAGLGWGGATLTVVRATNQNSIDGLLANSNASTFSIGGGFVHTALAVEVQVTDKMAIGAKGIYNMGFSSTPWKAQDKSLTTSDTFGGASFSLLFSYTLW
jgi:hypothetical protein